MKKQSRSRDRLRDMLVEDIMQYLRQWSEDNRRRAVLDLVERIQKDRFQIIEQRSDEWVDASARKRDHGKVYILDKSKVLSGSVNLTLGGLRNNAENLTLVDDLARVSYYLNQFNKYWEAKETFDITKELLDALLAWLTLASPVDVYLKTILALIPEKEEKAPRDNYKMPVKYQLVVIERVLRQLNTYGGAMLVASTGLGKTVMATHVALRLQRRK